MATQLTKEQQQVYDRQIRLWGHETQERLINSHVLIIGATGIHVETAKNLALAGIKISLCPGFQSGDTDDSLSPILNASHRTFNFFLAQTLTENGDRDRDAKDTVEALQALNPLVHVGYLPAIDLKSCLLSEEKQQYHEESANSVLTPFTAISIAIECCSFQSLIHLEDYCRQHNKGFLCSLNLGLSGALFMDFGPSHTLLKQQAPSNLTENISNPYKTTSIVKFPSLLEFMQFSAKDLPSGYQKRRNVQPNISLLCFYVLLHRLSQNTKESLDEYGRHIFESTVVENIDDAQQQLQEWSRVQGYAFPTSSAILGGLLAQEIQRYILKSDADFKNIIILNGLKSEGLAFNVGINFES